MRLKVPVMIGAGGGVVKSILFKKTGMGQPKALQSNRFRSDSGRR